MDGYVIGRKPLAREAVEMGWHIAVIAVAVPLVQRQMARNRYARAAALALLLSGAAWHAVSAYKGSRNRGWVTCLR